MGHLITILLLVLFAVTAIALDMFAEPITAAIRRRVPSFASEPDSFLLWSLSSLALLAYATIIMYLLTRP